MAESIRLEVVTPEKSVVSESAQIVMAPGSMGEFGVLSGHTPFLTTLKTGAREIQGRKWPRAVRLCQQRVRRSPS